MNQQFSLLHLGNNTQKKSFKYIFFYSEKDRVFLLEVCQVSRRGAQLYKYCELVDQNVIKINNINKINNTNNTKINKY